MSAAIGLVQLVRGATKESGTLFSNYLKLSKYRLSGLVAFTAGVGYVLRAEPSKESNSQTGETYLRQLGATTIGTWLTAASANTLNQMYEIRSDALMGRTRLRPLPSGRLSILHAAAFAFATGASGLALLSSETNGTATSLAAANLLLYAGVYTPLKAISTVNTWVGSVVGAIPPMLGWAAASGGALSGERERGAWALGSLLFLWQIPHFHALAVVARKDYAAGGLKMLAVSNPVANATWARVTAAAMIPIGLGFGYSNVTSSAFTWESALLGLWVYKGANRMAAAPMSPSAARPLFRASILHLPITLCLMMIHKTSYENSGARKKELAFLNDTRQFNHEIRVHHPWETMAPFPFLPVPMGAPVVVYEKERPKQ